MGDMSKEGGAELAVGELPELLLGRIRLRLHHRPCQELGQLRVPAERDPVDGFPRRWMKIILAPHIPRVRKSPIGTWERWCNTAAAWPLRVRQVISYSSAVRRGRMV